MKQKTKWSISTEIIIQAPVSIVWNVLTNTADYPKWNPFLIEVEGEIKKGSRLKNTIRTRNTTNVFRPVVLTVEAPHYFDWMGTLWHRSIFAGHHSFRLERLSPSQTKLIHHEHFSGVLAGMLFRKISSPTREGFIQMNQALKTAAEKLFQQAKNQLL